VQWKNQYEKNRTTEELDSQNRNGLKRRDFTMLGVATAATIAAPSILTNANAKSIQLAAKDRYETDVLIIGADCKTKCRSRWSKSKSLVRATGI
jgi:hypothetical protein